MKKIIGIIAIIVLILVIGAVACSNDSEVSDQGKGQVSGNNSTSSATLGDYEVVIDSCRIATDYEGKDVVIVKYIFTNKSNDDASAFYTSVQPTVFQNGVGLNEAYFLNDNANYSSDNQTKEIKKGASLEVEVAYTLNDKTSDIDVEVKEWISLNDKKIVKTFSLS